MEITDFNLIVLPLGIIVAVLILTILVLESRKDEIHDKKIQRALAKFKKEKADKQEVFNKEQAELDKLRKEKAINNDTYKRLSTLMLMNQKSLEETMDVLAFADSKKEKKKNKPAEDENPIPKQREFSES
jgi:hypothetical protein